MTNGLTNPIDRHLLARGHNTAWVSSKLTEQFELANADRTKLVLEKVRLQEEVETLTDQYNHLKELLLDQDQDVKRLTEQLTEVEEQFQVPPLHREPSTRALLSMIILFRSIQRAYTFPHSSIMRARDYNVQCVDMVYTYSYT